jgi:hypothetical protein
VPQARADRPLDGRPAGRPSSFPGPSSGRAGRLRGVSGSLRERWERIEASHNYGWVLLLVLIVMFLTIALPETELGRFIIVVAQAAALVVGAWTARAEPRMMHLVVAVAILALLTAGVALLIPGDATGILRVLTVLLVAGLPLILARGLGSAVRTQGVTMRVVTGVLTMYLLLVLLFGSIYVAIEELSGNAFFAGQPSDLRTGDFIYFSFTTQTTVGYGDFVPGTDIGRALAVLQAIIGQLYLVTVVSLVIANLGRGPRRVEAGRVMPPAEPGHEPADLR